VAEAKVHFLFGLSYLGPEHSFSLPVVVAGHIRRATDRIEPQGGSIIFVSIIEALVWRVGAGLTRLDSSLLSRTIARASVQDHLEARIRAQKTKRGPKNERRQ
jgi:hypothetical protein